MSAWLWAASVVAALPLAGWLYQKWGEWRDARRFPAPGRSFEGLHYYELGSAAATVVFESGLAASSLSWRGIQPRIAQRARSISYDRPGLGWSRAGAQPATVENLNARLHALVEHAGVRTPFVLVGHSFGCHLARHYAARYPGQVAGLVLVDPWDPSEWWPLEDRFRVMIERGSGLSRRGATLARFGLVRLALDLLQRGAYWFPKVIAKASSSQAGASLMGRLASEVRKLPPEVWPMVRSHWCLPRSFFAMAEALSLLPHAASQLPDARGVAAIPLIVISAGNLDAERLAVHAALARESARGVHMVAEGTEHWVQLDRPDLVSEAIEGVLATL